MTKEEFIAKLQMVYVGDKNASNELVSVYSELHQKNIELNNINDKLSSALNDAEQRIDETIGMIGLITRDIEENNIPPKMQDLDDILLILQGKDVKDDND